MDLKYYISIFQKQKLISQHFQIKLGELIINMTNNQLNYNDDQIRILIKLLMEYLCHKHYIEYINLNNKEKTGSQINSTNQIDDSNSSINHEISSNNNYDNCMNLLLVVLAKIAKLNHNYSILMIDYFVEHLNSHIECFNYIISFYRLYVSCSQIKVASKEYELYNNLFEFYKRMYYVSLKYENIDSYNLKDLKKFVKINNNNNSNDKRFFLDQFKSKNSEASSNTSNISDNSRHMDKSPESILMSQLRRDTTEEKLKNQKFSIFNPFKSQQKTQVSSKTERKVNSINSNVNVSGNKSTNSDNNLKTSFNQKSSTEIEINIENLKKKVPNLRLPINMIDQHFSLTRSSRRADFSSGTTSKKLQEKSNVLTIKRDSNEPVIVQNEKEKSVISNLKDQLEENEISPIEKLKTIAIQLGESCLATDLSCLINQKRDLELEKLAREKMGKRDSIINLFPGANFKKSSEFDYIEKLKNSEKIVSDYEIENKETFFKQDTKLVSDKLNDSYNINSNILEITKDFKQKFIFTFENNFDLSFDKNYKNYLKIREILSNFILSCIREFSIEEIHLVKINYNMIYCYITLPSIDQMRKKIEKKKFDNLESEFEIDYKNILTEGSVNILDRDINLVGNINTIDKFQKENNSKTRHDANILRDKSTFDSLLIINQEEEKGSKLSLKSEYESLVELLILHFSSIENNLKQQNFFKRIFESVDNPEPEKSEFWCDGIRFSNFLIFTQDKIRKHCDGFFDKIKNRISFILKNHEFKSSIDIWKSLKLQLITLRDYISHAKSRIISTFVLFEFTEILIILKKNFIVYFSHIALFDFTQDDMKFLDKIDSDYQINSEVLEMFSVYLDLIGKLIQNSNVIISDKLLNESFIVCPSFLEIIRFVVIYLFTHDINDKLDLTITNNLKNCNNASVTVSTRKLSGKKGQRLTLINFLKDYDIINFDIKTNIYENYKFFVSIALTIVNYFNVCSLFFHKIIKQENLDKMKSEEKEFSRYWICSTRDFLKFLNLFIESKNGLFYEYISEYGSYMKVKSDSNSKTINQTAVPVNFPLTKAILNLFHSVFDFSHNLSIIVNENTSLELIRMHYICFIKFYNKNLDFISKIGDFNKLLENCTDKKKKINQLIKDIYNDTNSLNLIICLCKLHLRCLFSLAKNRNSDVTNKFYQLRIVEVLVRELDLEHEANENTYKLQKYYESCKNTDKEQKDKIKMDNLIKEKNQQEIDFIINDKLDSNFEKQEEKIKEVEKKPFNFKNIFKKKQKVEENVQNISLNPNDQQNNLEKKISLNEEDQDNLIAKKESNEDLDSDLEDINLCDYQPKNTMYENKIPKLELPQTLSDIGLGGASFQVNMNQSEHKKNPFSFNKKPKLNMSKISSNNNEIISMIDKTKTPVFNINICDKFIEFSGGKEISEIPENKDNISAANKSSNRDKSFNEDNEEFDDIPLCDYKPKNNQYENKIPKLNIHENNNQDENNKIFEEKKEKPKVSFNAKFDFKKKNIPKPEKPPVEESEPDNKISDDSFNEDNESFDDVPLCDYLPKNNQYENKIPKLELPNTLSDIGLGGSVQHKEEKKEPPKVSFNKSNFVFKKKDADQSINKLSEKPPITIEEPKVKSSRDNNSFNEDNESFDDIPLCDYLPKNNQYENKIPKLELPNTLSDIGLGGSVQHKEEEKPKFSFNKSNFVFKKKDSQSVTIDGVQKSELNQLNKKEKTSRENSMCDDEFDDIQLCDHLPKNNQYESKIPKLELPTSLSDIGLGGPGEIKSKITKNNLNIKYQEFSNNKNKSNNDIKSVTPNKFSLKHKLQNKSGILKDFNLSDNEAKINGHERKNSMPINKVDSAISLDNNDFTNTKKGTILIK